MIYLNLIFLLIFLFLQVFDVWSTLQILKAGGRELNPIERWLIIKTNIITGLLIIKIPVCLAFATLFYFIPSSRFLAFLFGGLNIYYSAVFAKYNFRNI